MGWVVVGIDVAALGVQAIAPDMHVDNFFPAPARGAADPGERWRTAEKFCVKSE